jgi:hypothetical protein
MPSEAGLTCLTLSLLKGYANASAVRNYAGGVGADSEDSRHEWVKIAAFLISRGAAWSPKWLSKLGDTELTFILGSFPTRRYQDSLSVLLRQYLLNYPLSLTMVNNVGESPLRIVCRTLASISINSRPDLANDVDIVVQAFCRLCTSGSQSNTWNKQADEILRISETTSNSYLAHVHSTIVKQRISLPRDLHVPAVVTAASEAHVPLPDYVTGNAGSGQGPGHQKLLSLRNELSPQRSHRQVRIVDENKPNTESSSGALKGNNKALGDGVRKSHTLTDNQAKPLLSLDNQLALSSVASKAKRYAPLSTIK